MKITKQQLKQIIKEELEAAEAPDEAGVHRETINKTAQLLGLKIQSLYGEIMRELEYGQLKDLDRDETKQALYNAARDLRSVQASNAISAVVLKKLKMLDPIANLLEQIGDAIVAFGE
tara:strand:+ start:1036 stop:1389 length:354 start_codon:yes stop_codon:yes gene_type:complete